MIANSHRPLLLGHRGARALKSIPENTLASFDQALADGCDGFEFDVRLAGDQAAVVCHDPQFKGVEIARAGCEQLAGLVQLHEVLARYRDRAFLDIELKVSGLEKITLHFLRKYPPQRGFVVSSFLPEVLQELHSLDGGPPLGLICETRAELDRWSELPVGLVIPHWKLVDSALIGEIKAAGKKILVWTVNAEAEMKRLAGLGVDGIVSDKTEVLCRTLNR